jgi:hypothetical protein
MLRPPAPAHYLRANHAEWAPRSVIFLDTETRTLPTERGDVETLRLWAAHYIDRVAPKHAAPRDTWGDGDTAAELAAWLEVTTRNRESVWIFAHNLSFDLTTTRLPLEMVRAGWEVGDASVGGKSPWMRLRRGKRVLTLADSYSWVPRPLEEVGRMVGLAKPELPARDDGRGWWLARCRADVEIMERAILSIMAWWEEHRLGRWNISGPSCGWNAFRHKASPERILIDPAPTITREERKAYHGGRRGTWSIGDHAAGPFAELDFTAAYPTVAATLPLPVGRSYPFPSLPTTDPVLSSDRWGVVARVLVQTDTPRWPVRTAGGTWYPVGRFWTHLAGPDIREAARLGCLLQVGEGWVHRLGMAMAPWARWVLDVQNGRDDTAPEVARVLAKEWGRTVIGKWGARSFEKIKLGPAPTDGWSYEEGWNHSVDAHCGMVDLAGQRWLVTSSAEGDNAYPAIPAWVESEVRVRLNRVIEALGPGAVLQCDTDGLIVAERVVGTAAAHGHLVAPQSVPARGRLQWCLDQIDPVAAPLQLRVKRRLAHVTVLGPQHVIRDGVRRFAGLPGMAEETAPGQFKVKLWPKLQWQMANGDRRGYLRPEVRPVVKGPWPTGWVLSDNRVVPVQTKLDDDGRVVILPWWSTSYARADLSPAELQHPRLAPLG